MGLSEGKAEGWPWKRELERVIPRGEGQRGSVLRESISLVIPREERKSRSVLGEKVRKGHPRGRGSFPEERIRKRQPLGRRSKEIIPRGEGHPQHQAAQHGEKQALGRKLPSPLSPLPVPCWHPGSPCHADGRCSPHTPPSQDPLPWATCPLNSNRTGYEAECEKTSSTQYFWYRQTLNISSSLEASGNVQWEQALCLTLAWLVVYLCILRGTESTGKVRGRRSPAEPKQDMGRINKCQKAAGMAAVTWGYGISPGAASPAASAALLSCK